MTSSVPTVVSTWRSRTRCACPVSSPLGFSLDDMALLVIASGEESAQPGFVDADKYELCANLHLAECNWLVEKEPDHEAVHVVRADPHPAERRRHQGAGGVRRRGEGQAPADRRAVRAEAADRRARRGPGLRPGLRPALQRAREGVHRSRERRDHAGPRRGRRRAPRTAAHRDGRAVPHAARTLPPRDRPLLLLPPGRARRRTTRSGSASCSAMPMPTTRRRWTATTRRARRRTGRRTMCPPTPPCTRPRTGPKPSRTTCTSATRWTPPRRSASPRPPRRSSENVGPQRLRPDHRHVAAAVVGAEHDQPVDGQARTSTRSCCPRRCWTRCGSSIPSSTRSPLTQPNSPWPAVRKAVQVGSPGHAVDLGLAGEQNQIQASRREQPGEFRADALRTARDDRPRPVVSKFSHRSIVPCRARYARPRGEIRYPTSRLMVRPRPLSWRTRRLNRGVSRPTRGGQVGSANRLVGGDHCQVLPRPRRPSPAASHRCRRALMASTSASLSWSLAASSGRSSGAGRTPRWRRCAGPACGPGPPARTWRRDSPRRGPARRSRGGCRGIR